MAKKSTWVCRNCGYESLTWQGLCPSCKQGGTFDEVYDNITKGAGGRTKGGQGETGRGQFRTLDDVAAEDYTRIATGITELDRVLGGGIVPGSYMVLGAHPGAGKSTLASQLLGALRDKKLKVALIAGEESAAQIKLRYQRLGIDMDGIYITGENNLDLTLPDVIDGNYDFLVVDSVQTVYTEDASGVEGSVSQVREAGNKLRTVAKTHGVTTLLIGQVTKDGSLAGPKHLEHMVDVVMNIEGDENSPWRILRKSKDRFWTIDEIGVFEMTEKGMMGVANPSTVWMTERETPEVGSVICPTLEGTRPIMVEVNCLAVESDFPMPVRSAVGIDQKRFNNLVAVLQRKAGLRLRQYDLYLNLAGGIKSQDPQLDLAICMAITSAVTGNTPKKGLAAWGEVTLLGEVRKGLGEERRRKECERLELNNPVSGAGKGIIKLADSLHQGLDNND